MQAGEPVITSTTNATDTGDAAPACGLAFGRGVWFSFTPPSNGVVRVSTCGSDFDTVLQVYTSDCGALTPVVGGCNDDGGPACPEFQASAQFLGMAGVTYRILAGGSTAEAGTLHIVASMTAELSNDRCHGAIALEPGTEFTMSTANATQTDDPIPPCASTFGGVWFKVTPSSNGVVRLSTCGSDFDTALAVYSGSCDALSAVSEACNDDDGPSCAGLAASVQFLGSSGVTYWVLAGGANETRGTLRITTTQIPAIPNDQCSGAVALQADVPFMMSTTNATGTGDPGPVCASVFGGGVWFRFTPGGNGVVTVNTCGSDFDTVLQVYGGDCDSLTPLTGACNDLGGPACGGVQASLRFAATSGLTYWILAGGYADARGMLNILVTLTPALPNDQCAGAITLQPDMPFEMNTAYATETGDPTPTCATEPGGGVWFTFTPAMNGVVKISTCGSDFDTIVQAYAGDCGGLMPVGGGCNDNNGPLCAGFQASVQFTGASNATYWIFAAGAHGSRGRLNILAQMTPVLANDQCVGAIALQQGVPLAMSTIDATATGDPPPTCSASIGGGVWFTFTPQSDGVVRVSTCGSDFDTIVQVFAGPCPADSTLAAPVGSSVDGGIGGALTPVPGGCNDDSGPGCVGFQASTQSVGARDVTYWILAGHFGGAGGNLNLMAEVLGPALPNDECSGAIPLSPGLPISMSTRNATDSGDLRPTCQTNFGGGVWFSFTPMSDGPVTISTCGSDFDTVLQVYAGSCDALTPVAGGCNDSSGPPTLPLNSQLCTQLAGVQFPGIGGTTYWILAGGSFGARGTLKIVADPMPPANDGCVGAVILQPRFPVTLDTFFAERGGDVPPACRTNFGGGVWFVLTPAADGMISVDTCESSFDTVLQVFSGTCNALTPVPGGCNDDFGPICSSNRASIQFPGVGGQTYWILSGGYAAARGALTIVADYPAPPPPRLAISPFGTGNWQLAILNGPPMFSYTLQASANLLDWTDLASITIGATGSALFTDTSATNHATRLYRLTAP